MGAALASAGRQVGAALDQASVEDIVQQEHSQLDTGRVRAFIPVLVEHAARNRLSR